MGEDAIQAAGNRQEVFDGAVGDGDSKGERGRGGWVPRGEVFRAVEQGGGAIQRVYDVVDGAALEGQ